MCANYFCHPVVTNFLVIGIHSLEKDYVKSSDIYKYSDYLEFLRSEMCAPTGPHQRKKSHRQWARALGYRSARSVGMVLEGDRVPSSQMLLQLAAQMRLDDSQKRYFELLVLREKLKRSGRPTEKIDTEIRKSNPHGRSVKILAPNYFKYISDWYHVVIKQLIGTKDFRLDFSWIRKRLKGDVTESDIRRALENMKNLGLIQIDGARVRVLDSNTTTTYDIPAESIRSHHRQMMAQAMKAMEEEPLSRRENASLTFRVNKKDLPRIKEKIRAFSDYIENNFEDIQSSDVFQLNVQFFPHTDLHTEPTKDA